MNGLTIYDIATEAGVSPATVSRVLNKKKCVSDKKRHDIEKIINKHNYKPNAAAQSLNSGTRVIGLMVADIRNPYYGSLAIECEIAANERGYTVLLCNMLSDPALEESHLEKLYAQRAEAIIQIGRRPDFLVTDPSYAEHVKRISKVIPYITSGKLDGVDCFCVRVDQQKAMKIVFDYLVSLGHSKIALIGGRKTVLPTYEKWNMYVSLLKKHKINYRKEYFLEGNYDNDAGYACMERLLKLKDPPRAVIAANDDCALGAILAAQDHGLSVPKDLSVIGFDNTRLSTLIRPSLTTVDYNYSRYGKALVDTAIQAATGGSPPREMFIDPIFVVRDSCGAPEV